MMQTLCYTERNIWTKSTLSFSFSIWTTLSSLVFSTRRAFTASKDSCKGQRDTCTYVRMQIHNTYTSPYVRTYADTYIIPIRHRMYVRTYVRITVRIQSVSQRALLFLQWQVITRHVRMYIHTYVHMYRLYLYVRMYICTYIQTVYVRMYVRRSV